MFYKSSPAVSEDTASS